MLIRIGIGRNRFREKNRLQFSTKNSEQISDESLLVLNPHNIFKRRETIEHPVPTRGRCLTRIRVLQTRRSLMNARRSD